MTRKVHLTSKAKSDLEHFLIKNEPGFPSNLKYLVKSSYARGVMAQALMGHFESSEKSLVIFGYEGLDLEIWCQVEGLFFLISIKRLGYKDLNTKFGHEAVDVIRNNYLRTVDKNFEAIRSIILNNFIDPEQLIKILRSKVDIITGSQSRVLMSKVNGHHLKTFQEAKRRINYHRRQVELLSKFDQLVSLVKYKKLNELKFYSMRSMVQIIEDNPIVKKRLSRFLESLGDVKFCYYSSEFVKVHKMVATFLSTTEGCQKLLKTLLEFYQRSVLKLPFDLSQKELDSKFLNGIISSGGTYMTNDFYIIYELSQAIKSKGKFLMLHADREGVLRLNSELGTIKVDKGLNKQGNIFYKAVKALNMIDGVRSTFCQRNVDEVLIMITGNLKVNYEKILKILIDCFKKIDRIDEFIVKEGQRSIFHSHLPGRLLYLDGGDFANPQEVVLFADKESQKHKHNHDRKLNLKYDSSLKITKHKSRSDLSIGQEGYEVFSSPIMNLISQLL